MANNITKTAAQFQHNQGVQHIEVSTAEAGQRIDNYIMRLIGIGSAPKSLIYRLMRKGDIRINKKRVKPTQRIEAGDIVRVPPMKVSPEVASGEVATIPRKWLEATASWVVEETEAWLVLDKPAGLAVHGGSGVDFGIIDVLRAERYRERYLELAHRLDRDTSGLLILGKNGTALRQIQQAMKLGSSIKRYELLVHGHWREEEIDVETPLKRVQRGNERIVETARAAEVAEGAAKKAHTVFRCLQRGMLSHQPVSLLEATLVTGRTHQIRVHAQSHGYPILFDEKYGDKTRDQALRDIEKSARKLQLRAVYLQLMQLYGESETLLCQYRIDGLRLTREVSKI